MKSSNLLAICFLVGSLAGSSVASGYISASPSFVSFPNTPVGSGGFSQSVTIRNNSNEIVENMSLYDNCFGDFQISNYGCYSRLPAHGSCSLNVQFRPLNEGYRTCTIRITATGSSETVSVSGNGVARLGVESEATAGFNESSEVGTQSGVATDALSVWREILPESSPTVSK